MNLLFLAALALPAAAQGGLKPGDVAPLESMTDTGEAAPLLEPGQVLLVNFWASWCAPCLEEMPLLNDLQQRLAGTGASVVAVNLDRKRAPADGVISHLGLSLPILFDPAGDLVGLFAPGALPTSYLIGADGRVQAVYEGGLDAAEISAIEGEINALLSDRVP